MSALSLPNSINLLKTGTMSTYMQIGNIKGNVSTKSYASWIHIDSFEQSVARQFSTQPGQAQERENAYPSFSAMTIRKKLDSASPQLFQLACEGREGQMVRIDLCRVSTSQIFPILSYTLNDVLIGLFKITHENDANPTEELTLHYNKIEMKYTPTDANNKRQNNIVASFDLKKASLA